MNKKFLALLSMLFFAAPCQADVTGNTFVQNLNVLDGYTLAYSLNLPGTMTNTSLNQSNYTVWNPVYSPAPLKSVAYYMELTNSTTNKSDWVLVTMDPGTTFNGDVFSLTVPSTTNTANATPNQNAVHAIANNVSTWISTSNVLPLKDVSTNAGTDANGQTVYSLSGKKGTVEFWTSNYGGGAALPTGTVGGSGSIDWNDSLGNTIALDPGHGSYQIHVVDTVDGSIKGQTLLSYSHMGNVNNVTGLGIGNTTAAAENDWTWGRNDNGTNYNGNEYSVKSLEILVKTATAEETAAYYAPVTAKYSAAPELKNMTLAYDLNIPNKSNFSNRNEPSKSNIPYTYDASGNLSYLNGSIGRVGYLMELDGDWVYASMDAFTQDVSKTGVPSKGFNGSFYKEGDSGAFDQTVSNLNVASNTAKVTTGSFAEGKIQFWGMNYGVSSAGGYDSNDVKSANGDYGSMQVFNTSTSGATETVLAYNNWGNTDTAADVGIGTSSSVIRDGDWTFAKNAAGYTDKNIKVFIEPSYITNVAEAKDYQLVYAANLGTGKFSGYSYDASSAFTGDVGRVGYYLELQKSGASESQWIFVSMDSFTTDVAKIGVPIKSTGVLEDTLVSHMNVASNVDGVLNGSDFTGKIQFWCGSYNDGARGYGPFDIRTDADENGYGSMQIFNASDDFSTLFAYNNFNRGTFPCLGIGDDPKAGTGSIAVDWTFDLNADKYTVRNLFILAQMANTALNSYETTNIPINQLFGTEKTTALETALTQTVEKGTALQAGALGMEKVVSGQTLGNQALASEADGPKFDFTQVGSGNAATSGTGILNGKITSSIDAPNSWTGFGMDTEGMVTLDLSELRTAAELPGGVDWKFSSLAEISQKDSSAGSGYAIALLSNESEVLGGYVNGEFFDAQEVGDSGIWELVNFDLAEIDALSYTNPAALFDFIIPDEADFLTLASTTAINGASGHLFWADPTLASSVPEPATWTLLVLGLFGMGWIRRQNGRAAIRTR